MSFTRRFFMAGLAAVLSVLRVPGISASETVDTPEFEYDEHEFRPFIDYLDVGEGEEMLGGAATESGWYLHPDCMIGCCASEGPFQSMEAAVAAHRRRWEGIAKELAEKRQKRPPSSLEVEDISWPL